MNDPVRPYDPDTVSLRTKVERHLRRKGGKSRRVTGHTLKQVSRTR